MKSKSNLLIQLENLPYFNRETMYSLGIKLGLKEGSIKTYISRFLKSREIYKMNNVYVSRTFFDKNKSNISYSFYLSNLIRQPSYISSWTALQYYNLTTESIYGFTAVTLKVTRNYDIKAGNFSYQSIKKDLFNNFALVKGNFDFFIASPSKALFDLLYFRTNQFKGLNCEKVEDLIKELRVDFSEMEKEEQDKFYLMLKNVIKNI